MRACVYATTKSSIALSLSLLMMMMMMQKRVSAIDKRTQSEERGFRDSSLFLKAFFFMFSTQQRKEQICCFLTHHPGPLLEEDAR